MSLVIRQQNQSRCLPQYILGLPELLQTIRTPYTCMAAWEEPLSAVREYRDEQVLRSMHIPEPQFASGNRVAMIRRRYFALTD